jgi:hypothetical protein
MLSLKKSLIFGCALLLTALVFFSGCPSPSSSDIFIPVTDITGVPATGTEGVEVDLSTATVVPAEAHYKTISWSVREAGTTIELSGEGIVNGKFTPAQPGTLVLTATIANGRAEGMDYTKDFTITVDVTEPPEKVSGVSLFGGESVLVVTWDAVAGATSYEVYYSETDTQPALPAQVLITNTFTGITGLTNGTTYYVWVKANNKLGVSDFSEVASGTPEAPTFPFSGKAGYFKGDSLAEWGGVFYDDGIGLSATHFYQYDDGALGISYSGDIVMHIPEDGETGRIIIRITDGGSWGKTVGSYYAIAYRAYRYSETMKVTTIQTSSATGTESSGVPTMAHAVVEYTADNSYFGIYGDYRQFKDTVPQTDSTLTLGTLVGAWAGEDNYGDEYFIRIVNPILTWTANLYGTGIANHQFAGTIVKTTTSSAADGYIYIKVDYVNPAGDYDALVAGNYFAIHWTDQSGGGIKLCAAYKYNGNNAGTSDLATAETTYTIGNSYFDTDAYVVITP